jgi:cell division protein FtsL
MSRARRTSSAHLAPLARTAAVVLVLAAVGVFHVWSRTRVLAAGYALGELQKEHVTLTSEHDRLRIEVETLRSPAALERVARTRLGMAPPAPGAVSAAGPRVAEAGEGGRGMDGAKHRPGPAEPSRVSVRARRAPAPLNARAPAPETAGLGPGLGLVHGTGATLVAQRTRTARAE